MGSILILIILIFVGSGSYAVVSTAVFKNEAVVLKKFKSYTSIRGKGLMAKEAALLAELRHQNIVKVTGVCENPATIMLELCQFSFQTFNSDTVCTNLSQFLEYLHETDTFEKFIPKLSNTIAKDLTAAIMFFHTNSMVHLDIKPENCLINNRLYPQKNEVDEELIKKQPIVVKLGDLGEARSAIIKTKAMQSTNASKTKNVERGSPAFMAPELLIKDIRLKRADIVSNKSITFCIVLQSILCA